jgi:hypothetical protein
VLRLMGNWGDRANDFKVNIQLVPILCLFFLPLTALQNRYGYCVERLHKVAIFLDTQQDKPLICSTLVDMNDKLGLEVVAFILID